MPNRIKDELHDVISGKSQVSHGAFIQTIASYLDDGSKSSAEIEDSKQIREQETKRLEDYLTAYNLWIEDIDFTQYISEGAEQRVPAPPKQPSLKVCKVC